MSRYLVNASNQAESTEQWRFLPPRVDLLDLFKSNAASVYEPTLAGQAARHTLIETGRVNSANMIIGWSSLVLQTRYNSLHSREVNLRVQYVTMKIALHARAQCISARSQGLYKGEEFIPCDSDLVVEYNDRW